MDFNEALNRLAEAMTPDQQKAANLKKDAISAAKKKNLALQNVSDDELDYDAVTNTVRKIKPQDIAKLKSLKVQV